MGNSIPRKLAERLSRGVVALRHLPREFQRLPLYVTPEARLRHWGSLGGVDPLLLRMARELVFPGAVVWDVGANVGLFAFSAAAVAGPSGSVLAIEPDIFLAQLLNRSAQRIALKKSRTAEVKILCAAVSAECGVQMLEITERGRALNRLRSGAGSSPTEGPRQLQPTVSVTLDSLLDSFKPPDILKIDVEGHETEVLCGAAGVLEGSRPIIWCEVDHANAEKVTELLGGKATGYSGRRRCHILLSRRRGGTRWRFPGRKWQLNQTWSTDRGLLSSFRRFACGARTRESSLG